MQQFIFVILIILFFLNNSFSNELPILTLKEQPVVKINNQKSATIVKVKSNKEEKIQEKSTEITVEKVSTTSNFRRSYRSCTSLG